MPRAALSSLEVERFRESLCEVATRLFAEHGYSGVTLRAIASDLGCSPMTPYRYFRDKAEIFEAVRRAAFARFADSQSAAAAPHADPVARLEALARAYVDFALSESHAYRIMFELDPPLDDGASEPRAEERRAWRVMRSAVSDAVDSGVLAGDTDTLAHLFWSGVHGLVALHLAGKLVLGRSLRDLIDPFLQLALASSSPEAGITIHPTSNESPTRASLAPSEETS
jgi:AcrR family transcriptional regulator